MRFLADESCDFAVVRGLRAAGHDVVSILESHPGITDDVVIDQAAAEKRILVTEDKDFGQLVFAHAYASSGVILIRFPSAMRPALAKTVVDIVAMYGERLTRAFTVVQPGRVRVARTPETSG